MIRTTGMNDLPLPVIKGELVSISAWIPWAKELSAMRGVLGTAPKRRVPWLGSLKNAATVFNSRMCSTRLSY